MLMLITNNRGSNIRGGGRGGRGGYRGGYRGYRGYRGRRTETYSDDDSVHDNEDYEYDDDKNINFTGESEHTSARGSNIGRGRGRGGRGRGNFNNAMDRNNTRPRSFSYDADEEKESPTFVYKENSNRKVVIKTRYEDGDERNFVQSQQLEPTKFSVCLNVELDCAYFKQYGYCKFGNNCKFKH